MLISSLNYFIISMRLHFATFVFDYASFSYFLILLRLHLVTFLFGYFISLLPHSLLFRFCISFNFLFLFAYVSDCLLALARTLLVTTSVLDRSYRLMMPWSSCKAIIIGLNGKKEIEHRRISMKNCAAQIQEQKAFFILWRPLHEAICNEKQLHHIYVSWTGRENI